MNVKTNKDLILNSLAVTSFNIQNTSLVAAILDEDNMISDRADALATQQSIKAYVDTGAGHVVGPASSTDNAIARFDGTTGKLIQNSVAILDDIGNLSGISTLTATSLVGTLLTAAQPNVTSLGTLINQRFTGDLTFVELTNDLILSVADQSVGDSTANIPDLAGTTQDFVFTTQTQTLSGKTLTTPIISGDVTFNEATNNLLLTVADQSVGVSTANIPDLAGTTQDFVFTTQTQTLTNKTITAVSNSVTARFLGTTGADVDIDSTAPTGAVQTLITTSTTTATWQTLPTMVFGEGHELFEDLTVTTVAVEVPTFTTVLTDTTASKTAGTYIFFWEFDWSADTPGRFIKAECLVDTVSRATYSIQQKNNNGVDTDTFAITGASSANRQHYSGFFEITFGVTATHTFTIQFSYEAGTGVPEIYVQNTRFVMWRVS